ncbi:MAG: ATP-dependent Clp protease ATP-binding subunit [Cyanobacteria bacterium P01_H01_bin.15]
MFEQFTDIAIKVVMLSQEEARRLNQNLVGTEHVLLGLLAEDTSGAAVALKKQGISLEGARQSVKRLSGQVSSFSPANIPFTPAVKRVFEQSFEQARQFGEGYIAPGHILLSLMKAADAMAVKILVQQGVELSQLRTDLIKEFGERPLAAVGAGAAANYEQSRRKGKDSILSEFSTDLTRAAVDGKLDPVIGRDTEVERVIQILCRRTKNNPVLIGEPGVGKTAIAEGLAQRIVNRDLPEILLDKQVLSLDLALLVSGTRFRGEFEERLKGIVEEVRSNANIILVIDEIHTLVGAGAMGGGMDASNMLKPALARGEIQCLGTTTFDEYRQYIERDAALERRFQPVKVGEPSTEEAIEILQGLRKEYEDFHKVKYSDESLEAAVKLSERYIADRFLPDKAIDLMDEAGSRVHLRHAQQTEPETSLTSSEVPTINPQALVPVIDKDEIAQIVAAVTGVPLTKVDETESESWLNLESTLHERVVGQEQAVSAIAGALKRARIGLKSRQRPIGSFIFAGPTGVGKTELAKTLACQLFGSEDALIRIDMSEFMESQSTSKLIGSPPGFVGYEEGGKLTEQVRRRPYAVILFDEIEKAHPDVFNLMLQLLDDGHLTDAKGRKVNFQNTLVILTSNLGAKVIEKGGAGLGFESADDLEQASYDRIRVRVNEELKQFFRPEFLNRLDDIVIFRQLTQAEVKEISDLLIQQISIRLQEQRDLTLTVTEAFRNKVAVEGFDPSYGARPLRRALTRLLEDSLAEAILQGHIFDGSTVQADVDETGKVEIKSIQTPVYALQPASA